MTRTWPVLLVLALSCKEPHLAEAEQQMDTATDLVAEARAELAKGKTDKAIAAFKKAISATPHDVTLYVQLAEVYQRTGNETGAVLTLKQAEQVRGESDPSLQRARADLYLKMHNVESAIKELLSLRDAELLTDSEILELAKLQAHAGKVDDAFATLGLVLKRAPDDPEAKTVEAEILLASGKELLAAALMDKLLTANPALTSARLLRAKYFLSNARADLAIQDLSVIAGEDAKRVDVVTQKAKALRELDRSEEAAQILEPLVEENPKDVELLALLAEARLELGKSSDAQVLVERVLALQPRFARALYVRGRALEAQSDRDGAAVDYEAALKTDNAFAPALSRLWRIYDKRDNKVEAMAALERLRYLNEITADEKVALARFYADTGSNVDRGKALIDEALKRDPKNAEYLAIKKKLQKLSAGGKRGGGVIIMKRR